MEPTLDVDTHNDESYAAPHLNRKPRHRKSSLIDRWIQDQQGQQTTPDVDVFSANEGQDNPLPAPGSLCHPYLAYPHLSRSSLPLNPVDEREADTRHRHDPGLTGDTSSESFFPRPLLPYSVPSSPLRLPPQTVFVHKPSSLRSFPIPFRPSTPSTAKMHREAQQTTSRHSLFKLLSRTGGYTSLSPAHTRSTSLDLLSHPTNTATSELPSQLPWKWRPSVLNHFGSLRSKDFCPPMDVFKPDGKPPATDSRQSTSSSYTSEDSARQLSFTTSIQSRRSSTSKVFKFGDGSASSPSLWSQTTSVSMSCHEHTHSAHMASTTRIPGSSQRSTVRVDVDIDSDGEDLHKTPLTSDFDPTMPYVAYSSQNSQRLSLSLLGNAARNRKKKRLVLKGVQFHDNKKFEAVKQWCERFGEVSQITRMPNGDLHVNFARAEVADTVCRLRANVHITGVGSVYLSWYTGNKLRFVSAFESLHSMDHPFFSYVRHCLYVMSRPFMRYNEPSPPVHDLGYVHILILLLIHDYRNFDTESGLPHSLQSYHTPLIWKRTGIRILSLLYSFRHFLHTCRSPKYHFVSHCEKRYSPHCIRNGENPRTLSILHIHI